MIGGPCAWIGWSDHIVRAYCTTMDILGDQS
jgi:hypothetical protein